MTTQEKNALRAVQQAADEVAAVQSERDRLSPAKLRPVLATFVSCWSAIYESLHAKARVPAHVSDVGAQAAELEASLFPDGLSFTQTDAASAWSEGRRRLERIKEEKLHHPIADLIGSEMRVAARDSTDALANAIGTGDAPRSMPSSTALAEALANFGRAVGAYGRVLAGTTDETDPAAVDRFQRAVEPMDAHRASIRSGTPSSAGDVAAPVVAQPVTAAPVVTQPVITAPIAKAANGASPPNATAPHQGAANGASAMVA